MAVRQCRSDAHNGFIGDAPASPEHELVLVIYTSIVICFATASSVCRGGAAVGRNLSARLAHSPSPKFLHIRHSSWLLSGARMHSPVSRAPKKIRLSSFCAGGEQLIASVEGLAAVAKFPLFRFSVCKSFPPERSLCGSWCLNHLDLITYAKKKIESTSSQSSYLPLS